MNAPVRIDLKDVSTIPSRRTEAWKYSDLRRYLRDEPLISPKLPEGEPNDGPFKALTSNELLIANGRMNWWSEDDLTEGVEVASHASPSAPRMADVMPMAALAAAKALDDVFIVSFKAGAPRTLALRWLSDAVKTGHHARVGIVVEAGANATLLESYEGWGDAYVANHLVEIFVEQDATLERIVLIEEPASAISITSAEVHLSRGAAFAQTTVASGARLQRLETGFKGWRRRWRTPARGLRCGLTGSMRCLATARRTSLPWFATTG
ncbi:MAG: Fe-S cluster assembly protein SufD [bacterium]|nr:MAG: Fe-S cluster assembly protein SufD [bacterium]